MKFLKLTISIYLHQDFFSLFRIDCKGGKLFWSSCSLCKLVWKTACPFVKSFVQRFNSGLLIFTVVAYGISYVIFASYSMNWSAVQQHALLIVISDKEIMLFIAFVCLLATLLKMLWTDCDENLWRGPGGNRSKSLYFGGDLDHNLALV